MLRQPMEQLKLVSNIRRTSRHANFMDYKLHQECWSGNPKTRWMGYILVDFIHDPLESYWSSSPDQCEHWRSTRKHGTCTRVPSPTDLLCICFPVFSLGCEEMKSMPSGKRESQKAKHCIPDSRCLIRKTVGSNMFPWWSGSSLNGPIDHSLLTL